MRNQVLTIEQMKHLKELGVDASNASMKLISNFPSSDCDDDTVYVAVDKSFYSKMYNERGHVFTLQDILELLPKKIVSVGGSDYFIEITFFEGNWCIEYIENAYDPAIYVKKSSKSILDTAYEMLCWCAENSYLTN